MELQIPCMSALDPINKRVKTPGGGDALAAGKVIAPWVYGGLVDGVAAGPYLSYYGIEAHKRGIV